MVILNALDTKDKFAPSPILVVEDNPIQTQFFRRELTAQLPKATQIDFANNGFEAIQQIFANRSHNLLLLDFNLPIQNSLPLNENTPVTSKISGLIEFFKSRHLQNDFQKLLHQLKLVFHRFTKSEQSTLLCKLAAEGFIDLSSGLNIATLTRFLIGEKINILMMSADAENKSHSIDQGFNQFFTKNAASLREAVKEISNLF